MHLNESPSHLIEIREAGRLPDARHDSTIIARAIYQGERLNMGDLREARARPPINIQRAERKKKIIEFIERAGGTSALAEKIGTTKNVVSLARTRAYFSKSLMYEIMKVAQEMGHDLPFELFKPIK